MTAQVVEVVDSHTGGEPTRVVVAGGPDLGTGSLAERALVFRHTFDDFRRAVVEEPRGSDVLVGALLVAPDSPDAAAGVIFFNNVGPLGMCGHGTIGLGVTLKHLGRVAAGVHRIDTPVGSVVATIEDGPYVSVENVPSWRLRTKVPVELPSGQRVHGDVAWGGNWFFLCNDHEQTIAPARVESLTEYAWTLRQSLAARGVTGANGAEIDHIELFGPPSDPELADSRSFVLCPGKAYDRSPCGTGTSAKLACLAADGKLLPGRIWRQESVVGSVFEATYRVDGPHIVPTIRGSAFVTAECRLLLDPSDPFVHGVRRG